MIFSSIKCMYFKSHLICFISWEAHKTFHFLFVFTRKPSQAISVQTENLSLAWKMLSLVGMLSMGPPVKCSQFQGLCFSDAITMWWEHHEVRPGVLRSWEQHNFLSWDPGFSQKGKLIWMWVFIYLFFLTTKGSCCSVFYMLDITSYAKPKK